jgi:hypothetical protein
MRWGFLGPMAKLAIVVALGVILVNDAGSIFSGYFRAEDEARRAAVEARRAYQTSRSARVAANAARLRAERNGGRLTGFQITADSIRVAIEISPSTWVAHKIPALDQYLSAKAQHNLSL